VSYQINITPTVRRELRALPGYVRAQALLLIDNFAAHPRPPRARELRGKPGIYRIWLAGHWRIAYSIDDDQQTVFILRVRLKEDIDYDSLGSPE
jgi:mRNA-degrading endonuclease RelE of RelBE toxin-antitoxin system